MKIISLRTGLGLAGALAALPTMAQAADTAAVAVNASLAPTCAFTSVPPAQVQVTPDVGEKNLGDLSYTCNFTGNANLVLDLPDGTTLRNPDNGGDAVAYGIRWLVPPNGVGTGYQVLAAGNYPFAWPTAGTPNVATGGPLMIQLTQPLTVAGTYTSVITYTIAP